MKVAILRPRLAFKCERAPLSEAVRSLSVLISRRTAALGQLLLETRLSRPEVRGQASLGQLCKTLNKAKISVFTLID